MSHSETIGRNPPKLNAKAIQRRGMNTAVVGLGSNVKPQENIQRATDLLNKEFSVLRQSRTLQTKAIGEKSQANFLNGAVLLKTDLSCEKLKAKLKALEKDLGRNKDQHGFVPRVIDLDLLVWNTQVVDQDFFERDFVKTLVLELVPDLKY